MNNFPGPVWSLRMFKYKEKPAFTYNIQSVVQCVWNAEGGAAFLQLNH